ncbi:MAG: serine hydrolase domain-containing protein [Syntrophobacteraceae bacterium]
MSRTPRNIDPRLDAAFDAALADGVFSGASLLISAPGLSLFERSWGYTAFGGVPVSPSTRFDLASLTKPLVTSPLCLTAIARGLLKLDDPLSRFFPAASVPPDKQGITIRHLLSHSSGFPPHRPFYLGLIEFPPEARRDEVLAMILQTPLEATPGKVAAYSDLGFILLGLILERLLGARLDRLARDFLFTPVGIEELHFCPIDTLAGRPEASGSAGHARFSFSATQLCPWRKRLLVGEVDDENAWVLDGVAGHAGLFGTAAGVFSFLSFLRSVYEGKINEPEWPQELLRRFWTRTGVPANNGWALGYDTPSLTDSSAGQYFSVNSIGHLGFTGVSFWLDLDRQVLVILLANRIHPTRQNDAMKQFRPHVHNIIMEALQS